MVSLSAPETTSEMGMLKPLTTQIGVTAVLVAFFGQDSSAGTAPALEPIVYTVSFPAPQEHVAQIDAVFPTENRPAIEIMMAMWSPGFYRVEDYAKRVDALEARTINGNAVAVDATRKNRWRIKTDRQAKVLVSYRLSCKQSSVTTNYVDQGLAVLNGAATFCTLVEPVRRPHEVRLELPAKWKQSATALEPAGDRRLNHYIAPDYDTLVDSPIVAGTPVTHEFEVEGSRHFAVDIGDVGAWDGERAALELQKIVAETRRFWGFLPFKSYYFLTVFRRGGGGLEHKNSTLLTASPTRMASGQSSFRWLSFVSHEYFHAFNVKRLRPIELGPFDYENPPHTGSLWIAEGLTTYFGDLIVARAGLCSQEAYLAAVSAHIDELQKSPGRLVQSLEKSSLEVWTSGTSGVGRNRANTVSYYVKGPVVGFLLDAKIRRATADKQCLDDVMRLAYKRYAGERGFTPGEFRATAEQVAGCDFKEWFRKAISSTEELDYADALGWFGLRFVPSDEMHKKQEPGEKPGSAKTDGAKKEPPRSWKLEVRADATQAQTGHLQKLLKPTT
jgi:predicted metalloprotease with PDZ domain